VARKVKDLNACIVRLQAVKSRGELDPEHRKCIEAAITELKWLRRKPHPTQQEAAETVRKVAEHLLNAFIDE
jgi:hypothetical protein